MRKVVLFLFMMMSPLIAREELSIREIRSEKLLKEGFSLYQEGKMKEALIFYKKAVRLSPKLADAWYWQGMAAFRYGLMDEAECAWRRYVELTKDPSILHKLNVYWRKEEEKEDLIHILTIEGDVRKESMFYAPTGLALDRFDNLYIAGFGNDAILKLSPFGRLITRFTHKEMEGPFSVAVDKDGNIWVSCFTGDRILKFSPDGKLILKIGEEGRKDGQFLGPQGITTDENGNLYVVDGGNGRVQKFTKDGEFILKIEGFLHPVHIALDDDTIWVTDERRRTITQFDSSGNMLSEIELPTGESPRGIFIKEKTFYITSERDVFIYSSKEGLFKSLKSLTETDLIEPTFCVVNRYGLLYVADGISSEITVFGPSDIREMRADIVVTRIDLNHYPIVLCYISFKVDGKDILGFSKENFRMVEENRVIFPLGVSEILMEKENLALSFVIEASSFMKKERKIKEILFETIDSLKGGVQGAAIFTFSDKEREVSPFTLNKTELKNGVESIKFCGTPSCEAMLSAMDKAISASLNLVAKKAIVLFTQIEEELSANRLIYYAKNNNIPIFVVDFRERRENRRLLEMAERTKGRYFPAHRSKEIHDLYASICNLLFDQNQYLLYYRSPASSLKWSNSWVTAYIEAGCGGLSLREKVQYLIPEGKGAVSGLERELIEQRIAEEERKRIEELRERLKKRKKMAEEVRKEEEAKRKPKEEHKEEKPKEEHKKEEEHKEH